MNVADGQLTVFRDLQQSEFLNQNVVSSGTIHPTAFPDVAIEVDKLVSIPE